MPAMIQYKCPCCGGSIEFDSTAQKMKCPYCDTEFELETLAAYDEALNQTQEDDMSWETTAGSQWQEGETDNMRIYSCKSCGGEIVGDASMGATSCPYCGNPTIIPSQFAGDLRPDVVIPFKMSKEDAKAGLRKHLSGKKLVPKVFRDENHIDEIKGVYVPFWLFDADAHVRATYRATRGLRSWRSGDYMMTEVDHFAVTRAGTVKFENVAIDGSNEMDDILMESIEPFDFSEAVPFSTAYLSGYCAERYDVKAEDSVERANARVRRSVDELYSGSNLQGYDTAERENCFIRLENGHTKYALYPVWMLNTTWRGQRYTFAMNGQTGRFIGDDLPMDKSAYWKGYAAWAVGFGVMGFLVTMLTYLM